MDGMAEIHHIRDWQLEDNDYCLDPNVEHDLPRKPKKIYKRDSVDESPKLSPERGDRRLSLVESIGSAVSPTDEARGATLEAYDANAAGKEEEEGEEAADRSDDVFMPHEEWKKAGGYV
ncbi:hypothetical protein ABW19_dt0206893 [Dactylella cylindrospora]|nr:hypothetical protein ABW19_dt0206893 [Dactylella cylindrospora]